MDGFEPQRKLAKIQGRIIDEEQTKWQLLGDEQRPLISENNAVLKIVDSHYLEIHEQKESYQNEKNV